MKSRASGLIACVGLLLISRFLWTKIEFATEGTGWLLLPSFAACVAAVLAIGASRGARLIVGRTARWVAVFMAWFALRLASDAGSAADFIGYTFGYGEGIVSAYLAGVAIRVLLDAVAGTEGAGLRWSWAAILLGYNVVSALGVEDAAIASGRVHATYALIYNDTYQVSGSFTSVLAVVVSAVVVRTLDDPVGLRPQAAPWILLALAACCLGALIRLSQMLGSNSAPVFMSAIGVFAISLELVRFHGRAAGGVRQPGAAPRRFRRNFARTARVCALLGLAIGGALAAAAALDVIDPTRFRMFGFEQSSLYNSSIESRLDILTDNFSAQLWHSPLLGNFFVDRATTGNGTYAHSLAAILPHLGLVGTVLFIVMLGGTAAQLRGQWVASEGHPREARFAMFAICATIWVMAFMLVTTFFTNILLWLTLGLLAPAVRIAMPCGRPSTVRSRGGVPSRRVAPRP